jgi:hypothetical protein
MGAALDGGLELLRVEGVKLGVKARQLFRGFFDVFG